MGRDGRIMALAPTAGQHARKYSEIVARYSPWPQGTIRMQVHGCAMKFTEGSFMIPVSCAESFGNFVHVQTEPCMRSVGVPPAALQVGAAVWGAENTVTFGSRAVSTRQANCSAMTAGPPTTRCGTASSITVINWSGDRSISSRWRMTRIPISRSVLARFPELPPCASRAYRPSAAAREASCREGQ